MNGNGNRIPDIIDPEKLAQANAQREAMMAAARMQARQNLAGIILNGICSGLYSNPAELTENFGDRAVRDAVAFADKLIAELDRPQHHPV